MDHVLKAVAAPKRGKVRLLLVVDPLAVPRGHRVLPRAAVHATDKRPSRARAKHQLRRRLDTEGPRPLGPLV